MTGRQKFSSVRARNPCLRRAEVARFALNQSVKVIDVNSVHHDSVGRVIVVTPRQDRFFYWLRFDLSPSGGRFGEEQIQAMA
jgi:hypothetical protein